MAPIFLDPRFAKEALTIAVLTLGSLVWLTSAQNVELLQSFKDPIKLNSSTPGVCDRQFPEEFKRDYRYYHIGYDYAGRPVVYCEIGRWKVRKWAELNDTTREMSYANIESYWCTLTNLTSPYRDAEEGITVIMDGDGFQASEMVSAEAVKLHIFSMRLGEKFVDSIADFMLINGNFVATSWLNLVRPVAGRIIGRLEVYGTRKERWLPILLSKMNANIIPPWVTGDKNYKNFKPIKIW